MRDGDGIERSAKATAHQRWARAILCLLFAFSTVLFLGHSVPAQAHSGAVHVEISADGGDPCDVDYGFSAEHCGTSSTCSFCGPLDTEWSQFDRTAAGPLPIAGTHIVGCVTQPHFQPPRLPLQA
jgi:hypothetical protein